MLGKELFGLIFCIVVYYFAEISIFTFLSDIKLQLWKKAFIISVFLFVNQVGILSPMLIDPFVFLAVLWLHGERKLNLRNIFLIFAPTVFVDLVSRFIVSIILPYLFAVHEVSFSNVWMNLLSYILVFLGLDMLNFLVGKEYKLFLNDESSDFSNQFYSIFLAFIFAYYLDIFVVMGFSDPFLSYQKEIIIPSAYKILFSGFTIFLIFLLSYFNHKSTHYLKEKISNEQAAYINNLENYGQNLEKLYRNVKHFQLDYLERLDQIGHSIERGNVREIQTVYQKSVNHANEFWDKNHYSISKLGKIKMSSVKSLLSAKIIEAEKIGIKVSLEVPDVIEDASILRYDLILILSIFCDNAIEAAIHSSEKIIEIACFLSDKNTLFIISNSTLCEKVDIKEIYEDGITTKGTGRGFGLAHVSKILRKYTNITLKTSSQGYRFTQTLIITNQEVSQK
ncbi:GHKL domain-containing protein [Streptococcus uberis]|uniref:GHKL domain-containing protein n=1 Tax=Streptococcus uberis TaxID=1349 RepID=UPI003891C8BE